MDLQLYLRVLWRFRVLVTTGLMLAFALAFFSYVQVGFRDGFIRFSPRDPEIWQSSGTLLLTQKGFPWGRSITRDVVPVNPGSEASGYQPRTQDDFVQRFADQSHFSNLANLYAHLVTSDQVFEELQRTGPVTGSFTASAVPHATDERFTLPFITITASGTSPGAATDLANRVTEAFRTYLTSEQQVNRVPADERVIVTPVNRPQGAGRTSGPSLTGPIIIFLTVMIAVIGLAFILENLRPRLRPVSADEGTLRHEDRAYSRHSA
jgi:capsular polysaccharide biosynthesis protein